jgi:hypothetical protein
MRASSRWSTSWEIDDGRRGKRRDRCDYREEQCIAMDNHLMGGICRNWGSNRLFCRGDGDRWYWDGREGLHKVQLNLMLLLAA